MTSHGAPLPSRRRGPLHPPNRPHPSSFVTSTTAAPSSSSFVPALSSPLRMSDATEHAQPSVFLSPNALSRKRSHFTSSSTPTGKGIESFDGFGARPTSQMSAYIGHDALAMPRNGQALGTDGSGIDQDASWSVGSGHHPHQPASSPTSKYSNSSGTWSRKQGANMGSHAASSGSPANGSGNLFSSHYSEPQTSQPLRPPQGEFSFQAQVPIAMQGDFRANGLDSAQNSDRTGQLPASENCSTAFARLAQAQRQQQEARRLAASGGSGSNGRAPQDDHYDGPPAKKRRGVASTLMDGALNAALYTGAAALTAYSLWSSWGRKAEEEEEPTMAEAQTTSQPPEKLPPGGLDEPPPPYAAEGTSSKVTSTSNQSPAVRPVHVFVSSRRRRPVFATHRSARKTPRRRIPFDDQASTSVVTPTATPFQHQQMFTSSETPLNGVNMEEQTRGIEGEDDADDDDEMFQRFQSKMSSLIEEGTRALHAKADLGAMDLEDDDDYLASPSIRPMTLSPSKSAPNGLSYLPGQPMQSSPFSQSTTASAALPRSQTTSSFLFGGSDKYGLGQTAGSSHHGGPSASTPFHSTHRPTASDAISTSSPRGPFLTLASRDPNSPYGRLSRTSSTPQRRQR